MRLLIMFTFLISYRYFLGQHILSAKISGGMSKITSNNFSNVTKPTDYCQPSGLFGLSYTYKIKTRFNIGGELLLSQIEGKEKLETPATDIYGNPTGDLITDEINKHISYLSIPVFFGISFKKLNVNLGFQTSFMLANNGREKGQVTTNGTTTTWDKTGKLNIDSYDYGARIGLGYEISNRIGVEANYYYGLNNIISNTVTIPNLKWTIQQVVLGVRYNFFIYKKETSEK